MLLCRKNKFIKKEILNLFFFLISFFSPFFFFFVLKRPQKAVGSEKMQILMVGAPTMLVNKYQKILSMAGLSVNALETESLSIIRALVLSENFPSSLIVNIGSVSTSLTIIRDGIMIFIFSIPIG